MTPTCADPALARLLNRCEITDGDCWTYRGGLHPKGYGYISWAGTSQLVHRLAYAVLVGPIPAGLQLDHLCRNRACCNPAHLEPVNNRTNALRGVGPTAVNAQMTHCKRGHEFSEENTYTFRGMRTCRACKRAYAAKRYAERTA